MALEHINLSKSAHLMSTDVKCAFLFGIKYFLRCPKAFILGTFKGMLINPLKNIHFSDNENIKNSDMLVYGVVYNRNDKQVAQPLPTIGKFSVTDLFSMDSTLFDVSILHWVTNKVFNLSIIRKNNLLFDQTLKMGEDLDFCMKYLEKIKFITVLDKYLYYYDRTNNKSLTNSNIKSLPECTKINNDNIKSFLERNNIDIDAFNSYKKEQFKYVESKINNSTFTKQEKDELISKNIILNMN